MKNLLEKITILIFLIIGIENPDLLINFIFDNNLYTHFNLNLENAEPFCQQLSNPLTETVQVTKVNPIPEDKWANSGFSEEEIAHFKRVEAGEDFTQQLFENVIIISFTLMIFYCVFCGAASV